MEEVDETTYPMRMGKDYENEINSKKGFVEITLHQLN
jgi:hypothetical protein